MEFQAKDIASFLNGEIVGNSNVRIFKVSKIEEGEPGSLSFLSNPKYENYLYTTRASVVLVNKEFEPRAEIGATLIKVDDAYQAFASLLDLFAQTTQIKKKGIESPSFISDSAEYGADIYVGVFAVIGKNIKQFSEPGVLKLRNLGGLEAGFKGIPVKNRRKLFMVTHQDCLSCSN